MEELMEILKELKPDADFENCEDLIGEGVLNSFDVIQIVAMVKEEFGVKIPVKSVIPANFRTVDTIWGVISELLDE